MVALEDVERASGLEFFPSLGEERHSPESLPPLCGPGAASRCGVGAGITGFVKTAKHEAHLLLAADCKALLAAWDEATGHAGEPKSDKERKARESEQYFMRARYNKTAETLACPLKA